MAIAKATIWDLAVTAGLERANGDYAVNFDVSLADELDVIVQLYDRAQGGMDIVYLRGERRTRTPWRRWAFYLSHPQHDQPDAPRLPSSARVRGLAAGSERDSPQPVA